MATHFTDADWLDRNEFDIDDNEFTRRVSEELKDIKKPSQKQRLKIYAKVAEELMPQPIKRG